MSKGYVFQRSLYIMTNILKFFKKTTAYEYVEEQAMFKHIFKRYFIKHINEEEKEFWAHSTEESGVSFYIGRFKNEKLIIAPDFYTLPYDVQKGGGRLCRIFLHNDWSEI